ncbi:MAG TPA: tRNA pseudouridine(13) synthase TruD, partial [Elusimicrobia bacterium]|nr:tRNA pseudouridine(13) synthase TruD [Elusimicrobiota bacterium]
MKLRQLPEDFIVEEVISLPQIFSSGQYPTYLLEKKNITTLDAVEIISRIWKKKKPEIGFCGLKDKHAYAKQYLSIRNGPKKNLELHAFSLKYLGERNRQLEIGDLRKNRFRITIRDLRREETKRLEQRADEVEKFGFPNYFDYQRFGSARPSGEFVARYLLKKDYETALKYILASSSKYETKIKKKISKTIAGHWGKWKELMDLIPKSSERSIINYLKDHPENFKTAFELIERRLRFLIVTSYQSYLWNEIVKLYLKKNLEENNLIPAHYQIERFNFDLLFYQFLPEERIKQWQDLS